MLSTGRRERSVSLEYVSTRGIPLRFILMKPSHGSVCVLFEQEVQSVNMCDLTQLWDFDVEGGVDSPLGGKHWLVFPLNAERLDVKA